MKNKTIILLLVLISIFLGNCTKLDEELFGRLSPETYYKTEAEGLSSVAGVYKYFAYVSDIGDVWRSEEFGTDEFYCPGRTSGGWFDQANIDLTRHQADKQNATLARTWAWYIFPEIGTANAVLESLEQSPNKDNFKALIAETRALRAYGYFYAMDLWGNVPIFTKARVDVNNLPKTNTRKEVYNFVVSEMLAAAEDMPSVTTVTKSSYYPRLTKEAIYSALAMIYLNAQVYSGTARWDSAIIMCDKVINTHAYMLESSTGKCFLSTNEVNSTELISSFSVDPFKTAGQNQFILYSQPALDKLKYGLPFSPACGYSTDTTALNRYEDFDDRKKLIEYGPQFYLDGVTPLADANGKQLVLIPLKSITAAEDWEGFHVLKYSPIGAQFSGYNGDNDLVLMRYADILLMKAEALFRTGDPDNALILINQIRSRSHASTWSSLTLKRIENERAREFIWEGSRRRDMIRFGTYFNETWSFKTTTTPEWRGIYPIPEVQIGTNPNLTQNPNY